jgi:Zn-dependent protease with chaperone function
MRSSSDASENAVTAGDPLQSVELLQAIWPQERAVPVRTVRCRHCGRHNRVKVPLAIAAQERQCCGACSGKLFLGRDEPLRDLASEAYQHSLDRRSLAALRSIPGVPALMRRLLEYAGDRTAQLLFMSEAIQCGEDQFPELIALLDRARMRLGMTERPVAYLGESPHMNALTTGVKEPIIVVRSALLDQMNDDEMIAILGHELGHLHADHPLYQGVARALVYGGATVSPAIRLLALPIERLLLRWLRHAEVTADRAALLASRDLGACIGMMFTFAGGNRPGTSKRTQMRLDTFVRQCRTLTSRQMRSALDGLVGSYLAAGRTHPYLAVRVIELIHWVEHGRYLNILAGDYPRRRNHVHHPLALPAGDTTKQEEPTV